MVNKRQTTSTSLNTTLCPNRRQRRTALNGDLDSTYTDDPRGPRYVIRGDVEENEVDVVCRFRSDGKLLIIITIYVVD